MRWSIICFSRGKSVCECGWCWMLADLFCCSFEDVVRGSGGELSMMSGGERNGYDKFPRDW